MSLEDYVKFLEDQRDSRFGLIQVYLRKKTQNDLIFSKRRVTATREEYGRVLAEARDRQANNSRFLLPMVHIEEVVEELMIVIYFFYPSLDLNDRFPQLQEPLEMFRFLHDGLSALAFLEARHTVHGNIRPELIYYNKEEQNYVLVDRLSENCGPSDSQLATIERRDTLYVSPEFFRKLMGDLAAPKHHHYKSECFALGMVLLSALVSEENYNEVYDLHRKTFDTTKFSELRGRVEERFFRGPEFAFLSRFLFDTLLSLDESKRKRPSRALVLLKTEFCHSESGSKILSGSRVVESARNSSQDISVKSEVSRQRRSSRDPKPGLWESMDPVAADLSPAKSLPDLEEFGNRPTIQKRSSNDKIRRLSDETVAHIEGKSTSERGMPTPPFGSQSPARRFTGDLPKSPPEKPEVKPRGHGSTEVKNSFEIGIRSPANFLTHRRETQGSLDVDAKAKRVDPSENYLDEDTEIKEQVFRESQKNILDKKTIKDSSIWDEDEQDKKMRAEGKPEPAATKGFAEGPSVDSQAIIFRPSEMNIQNHYSRNEQMSFSQNINETSEDILGRLAAGIDLYANESIDFLRSERHSDRNFSFAHNGSLMVLKGLDDGTGEGPEGGILHQLKLSAMNRGVGDSLFAKSSNPFRMDSTAFRFNSFAKEMGSEREKNDAELANFLPNEFREENPTLRILEEAEEENEQAYSRHESNAPPKNGSSPEGFHSDERQGTVDQTLVRPPRKFSQHDNFSASPAQPGSGLVGSGREAEGLNQEARGAADGLQPEFEKNKRQLRQNLSEKFMPQVREDLKLPGSKHFPLKPSQYGDELPYSSLQQGFLDDKSVQSHGRGRLQVHQAVSSQVSKRTIDIQTSTRSLENDVQEHNCETFTQTDVGSPATPRGRPKNFRATDKKDLEIASVKYSLPSQSNLDPLERGSISQSTKKRSLGETSFSLQIVKKPPQANPKKALEPMLPDGGDSNPAAYDRLPSTSVWALEESFCSGQSGSHHQGAASHLAVSKEAATDHEIPAVNLRALISGDSSILSKHTSGASGKDALAAKREAQNVSMEPRKVLVTSVERSDRDSDSSLSPSSQELIGRKLFDSSPSGLSTSEILKAERPATKTAPRPDQQSSVGKGLETFLAKDGPPKQSRPEETRPGASYRSHTPTLSLQKASSEPLRAQGIASHQLVRQTAEKSDSLTASGQGQAPRPTMHVQFINAPQIGLMTGPPRTSGDQRVLSGLPPGLQPTLSTPKNATSDPFKPLRFVNADKSLFLKKESSEQVSLGGSPSEVGQATPRATEARDLSGLKTEPRVRVVSRSPMRTLGFASNPQNPIPQKLESRNIVFVDRVVASEKGTLGEVRSLFPINRPPGRSSESHPGQTLASLAHPTTHRVVSGPIETVRGPSGSQPIPTTTFSKPNDPVQRPPQLKTQPGPSGKEGSTTKQQELVLDRYENGKPIYRFK